MKLEVSVIVIFRNEAKHIENCIRAILNQSFKNFELVLVNDASTDNGKQIVMSFKDLRIKYFENTYNLGVGRSRNFGLQNSQGKYIFFTDGDCIVDRNWISEGLKYFRKGYDGVEGRIVYAKQKPTIGDKVLDNLGGKNYWTANMAYSSDVLENIRGFDPYYVLVSEDVDLSLRVLQKGEIFFNKEMLVTHVHKRWTFKKLLMFYYRIGESLVHINKKLPKVSYGKTSFIALWAYLVMVILPPLFFVYMFRKYRIVSIFDSYILICYYFAFIALRYGIWKQSFKEGVFII